MMKKLRIGGVPEHFNFPWKHAIDNDYFQLDDIELVWKDFPGGTGAMVAALKNNELDLALLLTEGAVKEISTGAPFKIVTPYVDSPLIWGVHTAGTRKELNPNEKTPFNYAISRYGSGSHLMAYVRAKQLNIPVREDQMVVVGDLEGARKALKSGEADFFLWEKFMTKPLTDSGEFALADEFPTPWPCFMLVARTDYYEHNSQTIDQTVYSIRESVEMLRNLGGLAEKIANNYNLKATDVDLWLSVTKWTTESNIKKSELEKVLTSLKEVGMITGNPSIESLVFPTCSLK